MKISVFLNLMLLSFSILAAEQPETIPPKTKITRSIDWYNDQSQLWHTQLENDRSDVTAWVNYYLASRYAQKSEHELLEIVKQLVAAFPETYEALLVQGWNEGFSSKAGIFLNKAYNLNPHQPASYSSLILYNEFILNKAKRKEFSQKVFTTDLISQSLLNYSYNVLMSLESNAVLITEGDNTTIPLFVLQDVMNVREDVEILNLDMLCSQEYQQLKQNQTKLLFSGNTIMGNITDQKKLICLSLPEQNPSKNFYYALTLPMENITSIKDNLYIVGLASKLSKERLDNIPIIKQNLETRFLMDYLTVDFNGENALATGKMLSANYLVPLLLLNDYYVKNGELEKSKTLEDIVIKLAKETNKTDLVQRFIDQKRKIPFIPFNIKIKSVEASFKPIKQNIFAQEHEVTNEEYQLFLTYLKENNQTEFYEMYKIDLSGYEEPALSFMKGYTTPRTTTKREKYFSNYPVVSIAFESAQAYCQWLTEQYNNNQDRKYKKVKFRLPSINEWQVAALGYKKIQSWVLEENSIELQIQKNPNDMLCVKDCEHKVVPFKESGILYPWYGAYYFRNKALNSKGCALGNFKWPESQKPCMSKMSSADGWLLMAAVDSYFPNDMGLNDVVGNVAEMTAEKGKACGGSWNHTPEESTLLSINAYEKPDAAIGFRVFMEVLEP
jgi:formylglycine-generating enzyme required for sulfatase activity